jgi:hypothetical protein
MLSTLTQLGLRHGAAGIATADFGRGRFLVVVSDGHRLPVGETLMILENRSTSAFLDGASTNEQVVHQYNRSHDQQEMN